MARTLDKKILLAAIILGPVAVLVAALVLGIGQPRRRATAAGSMRGMNVLLVTIDTLRADRVGAWGSSRGLTPTLDRLATEGVAFADVRAQVPLTLPSHASLLTGRYPTATGVHDNGTFRLAQSQSTIATALDRTGYDTGAFVGAFVLDARFGLNRGFDVYDDRMEGTSANLEVVQRPAEQVLASAERWIDQRTGIRGSGLGGNSPQSPTPSSQSPFFAWIHLYDPHEPYSPPEPYRSRYATDPYDGEVAYVDAQLGAFLDRLRASGVLAHTLVAIASDHGESLGEHGERTHGLFAYDATLHVPMLLWNPAALDPGVFARPARLVDLTPTLLDLVGATPLDRTDGRSLRPFVAGERAFDEVPSYFEALNANLTRNWAPLTGVVFNHEKLIDLPIPELYDLQADPEEQRNLYAQQPDRARPLEAALDAVTAQRTPDSSPAALDAEAEARLRSLGYVVGPAPKTARKYTAADDPKRLVHLNSELDDAMARWSRGDAQGAVDELQAVIKERPDLTLAYDRLAFVLRASGRTADAAALLDRAARDGHADRALLRSLGGALRDTGDLQRSADVLRELVSSDATDLQAADALAQTYTRMGRFADAEAQFRRVLAASPNDGAAWTNLGAMLLMSGRAAEAVKALQRAVAVNSDLATAHNALGVAYAQTGNREGAAAEWKKALELRPDFADARANLERLR